MNCVICGKMVDTKTTKRGGERIPRGWHRNAEREPHCDVCWHRLFVLRAVTFPIAGPVPPVTWPVFRQLTSAAWSASTSVSNWAMTELRRRDVARHPAMEKLPKYVNQSLYHEARAFCPEMDSGSLVALLHAVDLRYKAKRCEIVWTGASSLPTHRWPVPFPLRSQDWSARWLSETERVPIVSIRLAGVRLEVRLRGGHEFRRQLDAFAQLVNGQAHSSEGSLYAITARHNDHRNGLAGRDHGEQKTAQRVMLKLVMWLPKPPLSNNTKELVLRRDADALLVAELSGAPAWRINADHVRRWMERWTRRSHRLATDRKYERRIGLDGDNLSATDAGAAKYSNRMNSFCHETSAAIVGYAARHNVGKIIYEAGKQTMLPEFQWFKLTTLMQQKAAAIHIEFCERKGDEENPQPARGKVSNEATES